MCLLTLAIRQQKTVEGEEERDLFFPMENNNNNNNNLVFLGRV